LIQIGQIKTVQALIEPSFDPTQPLLLLGNHSQLRVEIEPSLLGIIVFDPQNWQPSSALLVVVEGIILLKPD
jgi:hypothetical protein